MHEVAGSSPVESTKTPRFGVAVAGCFFVALFRQGERVGAALREQSVFAPLHFVYAFFGRKQTINYRLAGRAATGASPVESTKTPRFGIAVSGCFLLRVAISFMPYKKRRTKSIRCLSYGAIFCLLYRKRLLSYAAASAAVSSAGEAAEMSAAAASAEERAAAFGFRAGHRRYERRTQHGIE